MNRSLCLALLGFFGLMLCSQQALAQRMPPPSGIDDWISPHNQNRLKLSEEILPEYRSKKLPDGSEKPPRAPWPFVLLVVEQTTRASDKILNQLFQDARIIVMTRAVKLVRVTPEKAVDLPYLTKISNLRDPSLLFIDREFKVLGTVTDPRKFEERGVVPMFTKLADPEYPIKLTAFVSRYFDVMKDEEKLWKDEKKINVLQDKAAQAKPDRRERYDAEADALEANVESTREKLIERERALLAELAVRVEEAPALPTTFGSGRVKRELSEEEKEAIAAYREFALNDNPHVRSAAVEDLGLIDSGAMVEFILTAAKDVDPRVVAACGRALGRMKSDEALETMLAGLGGGDSRSRRAAILGFANVRRTWPAAVPALIPLLSSSDDEIRLAALKALARQKHASATSAIVGLLDDKVPALRVMAAETLGSMRAEPAAPALVSKLTDKDWSLQKASAESLGLIRSRASIEPILQRFESEEGLLLEVLYKALVRITGQDFSIRPEYWRRWWDQYGAEFKLPSDGEVEKALTRMEKAMEKYNGPGASQYHTISTLSRKMLFVIDISASMADKIAVKPGVTEAQLAEFPSRVKMDIAKNELIELLAGLDPKTQFNIITFAGKTKSWRKGLVGMASRGSAIKFVAKLKPLEPTQSNRRGVEGGGEEQKTNTYAALRAAFGLAENQSITGQWKKRGEADTIFFVTDGEPTTGEIVDTLKLVNYFTDLNATRGLVIHLIAFDDQVAERLGGLATLNGGRVVVRSFGN